ncbi:hypothetical protein NW762_010904 [Fusarium torreyae]|uniref:Uncharacterized protein n=1 Tax=Fusarium torreyae TaxID=1237075 RepID=A0A9W8VCP1_9HYPO|nr:hypothetical protein NW762_010904 [Fusarium torreyae]
MDHIRSRTTKKEADLGEMRPFVSSDTNDRDEVNDSDNIIDHADTSRNCQNAPSANRRRSDSFYGFANAPRPSKASLLVNPGDQLPDYPHLDSRFNRGYWVPGMYPVWNFSPAYIRHAIDSRDSPETNVSIHILRHARAGDCQVQEDCPHWECVWDGQPRQEEGVVELRVLCIPEEHADESIHYYKGTSMIFEPENNIDCHPCRLFLELRPDFSGFRAQRGYLVVAWRLVEEEMSDEKWMDQWGRLLAQLGK